MIKCVLHQVLHFRNYMPYSLYLVPGGLILFYPFVGGGLLEREGLMEGGLLVLVLFKARVGAFYI